ncbi:C-C motif chemokine 5-like [Clarias gariepinus]|uniref:C-C motif chemokine 5-like n=1 Tax=Clarias gariepinus TaxID=13013 RepID=UPI00234C8843|nr:C-C motif chemokine 5-like [Clarias gariepinus]
MKMSRVCLVLSFILIMLLYSKAMPHSLDYIARPEPCCFEFFAGKIPSGNILEVKRTHPHCSTQGFVVTTPKHEKLCVHNLIVDGTATS